MRVESLIIVFGNVAREWVQNRLETAVQTAVSEGRLSLKLGVFVAPPPKRPEEMDFSVGWFINVHSLDNTHSFNPNTILAFLGGHA